MFIDKKVVTPEENSGNVTEVWAAVSVGQRYFLDIPAQQDMILDIKYFLCPNGIFIPIFLLVNIFIYVRIV